MLTADGAADNRLPEQGPPAIQPARPEDFAAAARRIAAERLQGDRVCRGCALQLIEELVRASVEFAHEAGRRAVRRAIEEQSRCPN